MFSRSAIIVFLLQAAWPVEAATLKGVVLVNELSGPPMENVEVDAISGTNHTESDSSGKFTLEFPQRRAGDTVRIIVKKEGYVVVNDIQLQLVLLVDADAAPLAVILAKEQDREEMARRFYRLKSFDAIEGTYQKNLRALQDAHVIDTAAIAKLQRERDQAKANAEKASEQLAKIQPSQGSELYQDAKRLFLAGKADEAIDLLDDERIHQENSEALNEARRKADQNAVQEWLLKAQLLTTKFRFDKAERAYVAAIDTAPDDFKANFAYAVFSYDLNRFEKAKLAYGRCLELARKSGNDFEAAGTLNNLGVLDNEQGRMEEARKEYGEALRTFRKLAEKDPETYRPYEARTLNGLGNLDHDQGRLQEAREEFGVALQTYRELAEKNPETYRPLLAGALDDLGHLDNDQGRLEEARKECEEALQIYRKLTDKKSDEYRPDVAQTLNDLGFLDSREDRIEEARSKYGEALQIRRELAERNPDGYRPSVAGTLTNLGILESAQSRREAP